MQLCIENVMLVIDGWYTYIDQLLTYKYPQTGKVGND